MDYFTEAVEMIANGEVYEDIGCRWRGEARYCKKLSE